MLERPRFSGRDAVSVRHRVPAFSLSREWWEGQEEGRKRKQEKGNASRALLSVCLHIVFLRDMLLDERDTFLEIGGNPPFLTRNREIWGAW
jgi:hypothetical protein